jgi:hypothetical protein
MQQFVENIDRVKEFAKTCTKIIQEKEKEQLKEEEAHIKSLYSQNQEGVLSEVELVELREMEVLNKIMLDKEEQLR